MRIARSEGFSLTEVLVALVLTGIALTGLMKLASGAFLQANEARTSVFVGSQINSLIASVQTNPAYWADAANPARSLPLNGATPPRAEACEIALCQPMQMAVWDMARVRDALTRRVTAPDGGVTCSGGTHISCVVQVSWQERMANRAAVRRELVQHFLP